MATLACLAEELSRHDGCINSCNAPALAKMDFQLNGGQNKLTIRGFAGRCDKNDTLKASDIALQGYSCHECESRNNFATKIEPAPVRHNEKQITRKHTSQITDTFGRVLCLVAPNGVLDHARA
jgi:hypothetical protein